MKAIDIWKPIDGFEGIYELRSDGLLHCFPRKWVKERYTFGNEWNGYLKIALTKNGVTESKRVNRLVWETFVGPIPDGYDVHHINHNKTDNRVENLELIESHTHRSEHRKEVYPIHKKQFHKAQIEKCSKPVLQYT